MPIQPKSFLHHFDAASGVVTLTLNRPERLNALTFEVYGELRDAFRALDAEPGVRAVVITGAGRAFCSGGDVEDIIGALFGRDANGLLEFTRMTCDLILAMRRCRRPVIGALNGLAAGAGAVIASACDVPRRRRVGEDRLPVRARRASGADMGASWLLPRLVGLGQATELLMTGDFIDARRAHAIGLYQRVVPDGQALEEATAPGRSTRARSGRGAGGDQACARAGSDARSRGRARPRGPGAGGADGAPELPRGVRGVPPEAHAAVHRMIPDLGPIRAFLEPRHLEFAAGIAAFAADEARARPEPRATLTRAATRVAGSRRWAPAAGSSRSGLRTGARAALAREALASASTLADAVFALQGLGGLPILLAGSEAFRSRWLAPAIEGKALAAFAMTEKEAGSDVAAMTTTARRDGDAYVLNGGKTLISNAGIADFYVVFASTDRSLGAKGIGAFLVPAGTKGLVFAGAQMLSAPHPLGEIVFEDCRVPLDHRLGEEGKGMALGLKTLDRLRATVGAAACGMAARALGEAIAHARTRRQFGRPLADFQLVQEKLARAPHRAHRRSAAGVPRDVGRRPRRRGASRSRRRWPRRTPPRPRSASSTTPFRCSAGRA